MVLPRILTALVFTPLVVWVIWLGSFPFFFFVMGITLLCQWEFSLMAEEGGYPNQLFPALFLGMLILFAFYWDGSPLGPMAKAPAPMMILCLSAFVIVLREFFRSDKGLAVLRIVTTLAGVILFPVMLGHMVLIRDLHVTVLDANKNVGRELLLFLTVTIWVVDTGAWLVGRLVGRNQMAPRISPKKTWEGALGGTILACGMACALQPILLKGFFSPVQAAIYALGVSIVAQVSDVTESLLKRSFNVKDSSQLLPGHGGFMDRFDSFIFGAPFFYDALLITGRFH